MKALLSILLMLRLPNLAIVFLSQWLPYYLVLRPAILRGGGIPRLDETMLQLLSLNTVLVTLGGNLINDIFDASIDARNRPERVVVGRYLSRTMVLLLYFLLLASTALLAIHLDLNYFHSKNFGLLVLFGGVSIALFAYSAFLKCTPLLGNLWVASLCAIVPLVIWFPERRPLQLLEFQDPALFQSTMMTFWNFVIFAFVATLFREMVKDLEDHVGDATCGCHTLPVLKGVRVAKRWASAVGLLMSGILMLLVFYWQQNEAPLWKIAVGIFGLILPSIFASLQTARGNAKSDFSRASLTIKLVMLAGIFLLSIT